MKIIYVIVPLELLEQFNRLNELEQIAKELCKFYNANFGFFGTCSFDKDNAISLLPKKHQIERLK